MIAIEQIPEETKNPSKTSNTGANKIDFFILFEIECCWSTKQL